MLISGPSSQEDLPQPQKSVKDSTKITSSIQKKVSSFFVRTTSEQKKSIDKQIARYIFATNTPFRNVEHPQFLKLVSDLRAGYNPPNRKEIGGPLLESIYEEEYLKFQEVLKDQSVCLGFDGWSNVHNEPIICITVTCKDGEVYLVETVDTSGHSHTAEYLAKVTGEVIRKCETDFSCKVRSVVTDNAANVTKTRQLLEQETDLSIITYGCSAHILNLLANDYQCNFTGVKQHVLYVVKYFRNNHSANACYRKSGAPKLIVPSEVRWNTMVDCLESYIKGWPVMLKICEENRDTIDTAVKNHVSDLNLKRNIEDMIVVLKPISVALDKIQRDLCSLSEALLTWKELGNDLKPKTDQKCLKKFMSRYNMAMTPAHFLAYLLDPKEKSQECDLTDEEKTMALDFAKNKYSESFLALVIKFQAKSVPFRETLFSPQVTAKVSAYEWWRSQKNDLDKYDNQMFPIIEQLFTAQASSASVERIFSSFGIVQSKLRNRLGTEKAAKLVFLFKILNKHTSVLS